MAHFSYGDSYRTDPAIFAFTYGNEHPISVTVDRQYIDLDRENKRTVPAGLFVAEYNNTFRFLPRGTVTQALVTGQDYFKMTPYNVFVPGDVLSILEPYSVLTITSASVGQTTTLSILNPTNANAVTSIAPSSVVTEVAEQVAKDFNKAPYISDHLNFFATGNKVYITSKNRISYEIEKGGTVTSTLSETVLTLDTNPIGTVKVHVPSTGTTYLEAVATVDVPVGVKIGVPVSKVLGLHSHAVDFNNAPSRDIAVCNQSPGVRKQLLPYFDYDLETRFPQMTFDTKF